MGAKESFEITNCNLQMKLTEPITKQLINSSYELLFLLDNFPAIKRNFTASFNELSNALNLNPQRLLNAFYILDLRDYTHVLNQIGDTTFIRLTQKGKDLARLHKQI